MNDTPIRIKTDNVWNIRKDAWTWPKWSCKLYLRGKVQLIQFIINECDKSFHNPNNSGVPFIPQIRKYTRQVCEPIHWICRFENGGLIRSRENSRRQREEPFLTWGALKQEFGTYLQCQVSGAFVPAVAPNPPQHNSNSQKGGRGRGGHYGGGGGRGGFQYNNRGGRGGGRGGFQYGGGRGGFQYSGGRGGYQHGGGTGGSGGGQDGSGGSGGSFYATLPSGYYGPNGYVILCKNYNAGRCKTQGATCILPSGATANHLCGARNANGDICKAQHPAIGHNWFRTDPGAAEFLYPVYARPSQYIMARA